MSTHAITVTDYRGARYPYPERTVEIRYTKRTWGGWNVVRADNGRQLGWIAREGRYWVARATEGAFRGSGPGDLGDVLDDVRGDLCCREPGGSHGPVGGGRCREDAAYDLIVWLVKKSAPAAGFGPHYAVRRYADR